VHDAPDVGVVMPVYVQDADYLRTALRTILNQTYGDFKFVVVVDGPLPEITRIVNDECRGDLRVEIVLKERNEGTAEALNTGFERLEHSPSVQYLTWVSSDNVHYPMLLEKLRHALLTADDGVGLSYSNFVYIGADGRPLAEFDVLQLRSERNQPKEKQIDISLIGAAFMYKVKYAALIDGYRMEPVEDFDYWLRLTDHCDIVYVPEELMDFRHHPPSSRSQEIHDSIELHRAWRYKLNLSRQQTRERRGLGCETTVVFPVRDGQQATSDTLEALLEQSYNNYRVLLVDVSGDGRALETLRAIEDPRICYVGGSEARPPPLREIVEKIDTPFTLLYQSRTLPARGTLEALRNVHQQLEGICEVVSAYYDPASNGIAYRTARVFSASNLRPTWARIRTLLRSGVPHVGATLLRTFRLARKPSPEPRFGELYRTEKLREILKARSLDLAQ
jgi:hypothetical protein